MKYRDLYFKIINDNKDNPDFEDSALKLLFLHAANTSDFISLLDLELDNKTYNKLNKDIDRYLNGELVQHIIGYSYFYGLKLYVNKNVLTPRQETEILVEKLLDEIQNEFNTNIKLLDIGTGSGAIGLVVKIIKKNIDVTLLDASIRALKVAKQNAESLGLDVKLIHSDIYKEINNELFDVIVSNPPYIDNVDDVDKRVLANEPHMALFEGSELYFYKRILKDAKFYLNKHNIIAFEHGYNQKDKLVELIKHYYPSGVIKCYKDYGGNDRVIIVINRS